MERKTFAGRFEVKSGPAGAVRARFATLDQIDKDGDVSLPGCFGVQPVRMQPYGHDTGSPSIGKGTIREVGKDVIADLQINLAMEKGREIYESLKFDMAVGKPLTQWSYIFEVIDSQPGKFQGQQVRFLKSLRVFSVDPVFLGAGVGTATVAVKDHRPRRTGVSKDGFFAGELRRMFLRDELDELAAAMRRYGIA